MQYIMPKNTYQTVEKPFFCQISRSEFTLTFPPINHRKYVDEVLFVGDVRKEDILRHRQLHISCEGDLDSDFAACAPLMCCVLGGWNAVTIVYYDGGPKVSRQIVTVEGAYILICWAMLYDGAMPHSRTHVEPRQLVRQCLVADVSR